MSDVVWKVELDDKTNQKRDEAIAHLDEADRRVVDIVNAMPHNRETFRLISTIGELRIAARGLAETLKDM